MPIKRKKPEPWEVVIHDRFISRKKPDNPYLTALLYFALFFMSVLLIFVSFVSLCQVNKTSMLNTLHNGDNVLVLKGDKSLKRGEIIVITVAQYVNGEFDSNRRENIIKRVVALPGDTVSLKTQPDDPSIVKLYLKTAGGAELAPVNEEYIREDMTAAAFRGTKLEPNKEYTVPEGMFVALGDNRNISVDSRNYGYFTFDSVYGTMFFRLEPGSWLEYLMKFIY